MNNQGRVLHCVSISEGTQSMVDINNRRIVEAALRHNASCVVLGHNHPNGVAVPVSDRCGNNVHAGAAVALHGYLAI